eukprot:TRINITY_DN4688_c0_g1_i3.p1 TRINITY_DN4688_c0_g1~~TRINITY_DN4688_c0_g1_i3.p1  ORF type:complete len:450 (-),score=78.25 TRINITY_DN4688_c0_g1_i3:1942-3267(-)
MRVKVEEIFWHENQPVFTVDFLNDKIFATGGADNSIKFWKLLDLQQLKDESTQIQHIATLEGGHTTGVNCIKFSPDGEFLVSGGDGGELFLWQQETVLDINSAEKKLTKKNLKDDNEEADVEMQVLQQEKVVEQQEQRTTQQTGTGNIDQQLSQQQDNSNNFNSIKNINTTNTNSDSCLQTDNNNVQGQLQIYDGQNNLNQIQQVAQEEKQEIFEDGIKIEQQQQQQNLVQESNNCDQNVVKKWKVRQQLRGHADDVQGVCWSGDGTTIFSCGIGHTTIAWDAIKGEIKQQWNLHKHYVQGICFDPSGDGMLTISSDKTVKIYGPKTRKKRKLESAAINEPKMVSKDVRNWDCQTTITKGDGSSYFFQGENLCVFFRRPAYSPDGQFAILPTGLNKKQNVAYIFTKNNWQKPAAALQMPISASITVAFCPVPFQKKLLNLK